MYKISGWLWKFKIFKNGKEVGVIQKQWSDTFHEVFDDADNFYITFPKNSTEIERKLLLSAVFRIDMAHFEGNN